MQYDSSAALEAALKAIVVRASADSRGAICEMLAPESVSSDALMKTWDVRYPLQAWMRNPVGTFHGGLMATILDNCAGMLIRAYAPDGWCPTVSATVNYHRPAPIEGFINVRAHIVSITSSLATVTALSWEHDETHPVASGTFTFFVRNAHQNESSHS